MLDWIIETPGRIRLIIGLLILGATGAAYWAGYIWPWGWIVGGTVTGSIIIGEF